MNSELFIRLKKLAANGEKIIVVDGNDAFMLMSLSAYEREQEKKSFGFAPTTLSDAAAEDILLDSGPHDDEPEISDDELIKKVNQDIAEWRAKEGEKKEQEPVLPVREAPKAEESVLTEEERYYLEPLE